MKLNQDTGKAVNREILLGFWKIHILHHAAEAPVIGQWMLKELRRHGYDISPGTLYPMLKRMEGNGWLRSEADPARGPKSPRKYYLTEQGRAVLAHVGVQVEELHRELKEEPSISPGPSKDS
jgi:PadR family transcriptional regulator, regulatory protein PadR